MRDALASIDALRDDEVVWITTVNTSGQPQSSPVWFHWDGETFVVFSQPGATKVANIARHPQVSLHLNGGEPGSTVVTIEAEATLADVSGDRRDAYVQKYGAAIARLDTDPSGYLADFSTAIVVRPLRARVFGST